MTQPTANIASHLTAMASRQPDRRAVVMARDGRGLTYAQLDQQSDAVARGLIEVGIGAGVRTVLLAPPSLDFFVLIFALFKCGAVTVCVDPGIGPKYLKRCLGEAEPDAFVGVAKAHLARRVLGWARATIATNVRVGPWAPLLGCSLGMDDLRQIGATSSHALPEATPDDTAAILFTSGSTGPPKGVVYTHGNFDAQVRALRDAFDIQPGEIDLSTFPLFALYAPAMGMTAVIPHMDFTRPGRVDPRNVIGPIETFGVTNLFGSPALLKRVGEYGRANDLRLKSLKRVISAGAPVSPRVIETFSSMLSDGVEIHTPYGATETIPVSTIASREILNDTAAQTAVGRGVCVGRPTPGMDVRVIRITDDALNEWDDALLAPAGVIGEIVVRGPQVTRSYFNRDEATRLAKIAAPQFGDGAFFHRMGDVGYLDDAGRLWMCGRKSQRVVTSDGDLYTVPCEAVFNTLPGVARTALVGVQMNGKVEPVLCVEPLSTLNTRDGDLETALGTAAQQNEHTRSIRTFLTYRRRGGFPVDIRHNAKIGREKLARWAARRLR